MCELGEESRGGPGEKAKDVSCDSLGGPLSTTTSTSVPASQKTDTQASQALGTLKAGISPGGGGQGGSL